MKKKNFIMGCIFVLSIFALNFFSFFQGGSISHVGFDYASLAITIDGKRSL